MSNLRHSFVKRLWQIDAFKDVTKSPGGKGFRLKLHEKQPDAPLSPFYVDLRLLQSDFPAKQMAVELLAREMQTIPGIGLLAAIPEAIVPIVSSLSDRLGLPMITPREAKGHGSGAKIDGIWQPGQVVGLFDDVVTKADSKIAAAKVLTDAHLIVKHVFVLVDRQQGGEAQLDQANLFLHAAVTLDTMLNQYVVDQMMSPDVFASIQEYRQAAA